MLVTYQNYTKMYGQKNIKFSWQSVSLELSWHLHVVTEEYHSGYWPVCSDLKLRQSKQGGYCVIG